MISKTTRQKTSDIEEKEIDFDTISEFTLLEEEEHRC